MPWYEDWFDSDLYEQVYGHRDLAEAERIVSFIKRIARPAPGTAILDIGTGRGRHARVLAQHGFTVTGLDLSERAIASARARAAEEGRDATFLTGDMRLPHFQERFDGVVNLFTSFGFFDDEADHGRAVQSMSDALRPGGWLVQDFLNAAHVRATLVPEDARTKDGTRIEQVRWINEDAPGGPRVEKRITVRPPDADAHVHEESVRLLTLDDFRRIYENAGLNFISAFGDDTGQPLTPESPRLILHAQKRRAEKTST